MKKGQIKDRVGETLTQKCGLKAIIIAYRGCNDMDICFENGTVRKHVAYKDFKACALAEFSNEQKRAMRVAEVRKMNCGMDAMITDYRRCYDIDVEFEDNSVKNGAYYSNFKKGSVRPHKNRVGEKRMMNCGVSAEIIAYRGNKDIDVKFKDGTVRKNMSYGAFTSGSIAQWATKNTKRIEHAKEHANEEALMRCGLYATITAYHSGNNIDIRFSDGTEKKHVAYHNFKIGNIAPDIDHVGEIRPMKCGLVAQVIAFRNDHDIDIQFVDSGFVKKGVTYSTFRTGNFKAPVLDHKGQPFNSLGDMCGHYHIMYQTYYQRMKKGWTKEEALTTPVG